MRRRIILDVDTGIDDSLALLYLLASPEAEILGIAATAGNVAADRVALNNLAWLELCGVPTIEVALGAPEPLAIPLRTTEDTMVENAAQVKNIRNSLRQNAKKNG